MQRKIFEAALKSLEQRNKELAERLDKLAEQASQPVSYKPEGYNRDEMRLAAEGLHRLADIVEKKSPVKVIVEGLPSLLYPPEVQRQAASKKAREEAATSVDILTQLLGEEYIEEGGAKEG